MGEHVTVKLNALIHAGLSPTEAWTHLHPNGHDCPLGHCLDQQTRDEHLATIEQARADQLARGGIEAQREIESSASRKASKELHRPESQ